MQCLKEIYKLEQCEASIIANISGGKTQKARSNVFPELINLKCLKL